MKLRPGQEGSLVVQAMNEDTYAVDDVQVIFLELDLSRFEFIDSQRDGYFAQTTGFDKDTGLRGAARIKFRVKPDAPYGTASIAASLTQAEQMPDAGSRPTPAMTMLAVEVVPDLTTVKLTALPSALIEMQSESPEARVLSVQTTDEQGRPINGIELYAEVFGGVDSPVTLVEGEASQPRAIHATQRASVSGFMVDGVAQWKVRSKAAVEQPMASQVRFGLARSDGATTVSHLGKFDINILPAEESSP
ncbi:hypothetical protein HJC10_30570 [Corallococcus exiguus]|uniref:hypothetical protein n=1 Tax=Corallococcus exiguus TaxID=83462 RepID=UPI001470B6C4|nr:hypothetical protein [Corallococcus exiguus]NNB87398.1 hypothetical protein [Corallococcus exiguus]NNB97761.1 hypothetical protein [Corallococcus exiguus]NNC07181.1 hypothetical protein [Corallococcus exiguus]